MTSRRSSRHHRKSSGRRVWVFSELNHGMTPAQMAKVLTSAGLEQARREAEAQATSGPAPEGEVADE